MLSGTVESVLWQGDILKRHHRVRRASGFASARRHPASRLSLARPSRCVFPRTTPC
ncbi:MAG: hypothetical protein WDM84_03110 [Bauldia sp.]